VSGLCNEYELQPSVLYHWLKQAMENLGAAVEQAAPKKADQRDKQLAADNEHLKAKLADKDGVIAELSAEYVQRKKALGEA
jgi:transposase-like protein